MDVLSDSVKSRKAVLWTAADQFQLTPSCSLKRSPLQRVVGDIPPSWVDFDPDVPSQHPSWRCINQEALCLVDRSSGKQSGFATTQHILADSIYIAGVKAKIAWTKIKHPRRTSFKAAALGKRAQNSV